MKTVETKKMPRNPTLGSLDFKLALIRKQQLKTELTENKLKIKKIRKKKECNYAT